MRLFTKSVTNAGLVVLRVSVAAAVHLDALGHYGPAGSAWRLALLWLCSAGLLVGFFTPLFAAIAAVVELTLFFGTGADQLWLIVAAVNAVALGLLGPGGHSLDALIYGRRTVVMTSPTRSGRA